MKVSAIVLVKIALTLAATKQKQFRTFHTISDDVIVLKSNSGIQNELLCMSLCVLEDDQCPMYHYDL